MKFLRALLLSFVLLLHTIKIGFSEKDNSPHSLSLSGFIQRSAQKDQVFEEILIERLPLPYRKALAMPPGDWVFSIKGQYDYLTDPQREKPEGSLSLQKLFPYAGRAVSVRYNTRPSLSSSLNTSDIGVEMTQEIAENAFGKSTQLADKIVAIQVELAEYQIIEAYEDYLATIIIGYYNWYEAHENLKVGESSYQENLKLLDDINNRQKSSVALPIDVNKIKVQVLSKKEQLIGLREEYKRAWNFITRVIRAENEELFLPEKPSLYSLRNGSLEDVFNYFKKTSRTFKMLALLEKQNQKEISLLTNELLPSLQLRLGVSQEGDDLKIRDASQKSFIGVSLDWPLPDRVKKAQLETAKVARNKSSLKTINTRFDLLTQLKNLSIQMDREKEISSIVKERINLSRSILRDETENYSYGKVTLNDYIQAVNSLDNNRFNQIFHEMNAKRLLIEFYRLSDQLVTRKFIKELHPDQSFEWKINGKNP